MFLTFTFYIASFYYSQINTMDSNTSIDKYQIFLNWFAKNGGCYSHIKYPAFFQPTNYIGIAAAEDISRNTVIMAVPKAIIIGIDRVRHSEIAFLLDKYPCFNGEDNDDKDFNILTLFLILEKMKGKDSFFAPYLDCITIAETMVHWTNQEILALDEPYLNLPFIEEVRKQFEPTLAIFQQIVSQNRQFFKQQLTFQLFYECYGMTMTRCFGWGLPETMMVPFADFLNHHSEGVHHYAFSAKLQTQNHHDYIKKSTALDLQTLGIDNANKLPVGYQKDKRELYLQENRDVLENLGLPLKISVQKQTHHEFTVKLNALRAVKTVEHYNNDIYPSSESQDNDTNSDDSEQEQQESKWGVEAIRFLRIRKFFNQLFTFVKKYKQQQFYQPKPQINREFDDDVKFDWWYDQQDSCFIVATSRAMDKDEQIYNSYGRRNNRFLLLWYGFTFNGNKYDSVPFRIWAEKIQQSTGQLLFTRYITDVDWKQQIPLGNERYPYTYLSSEFRLKKTQLDYKLLSYLRFRVTKNEKRYASYRNRYNQLYKILDLEVQKDVFKMYHKILVELIKKYGLDRQKDFSCLKHQRRVFAIILTESNAEIVQRHCKAVDVILRILNKVTAKTKKQDLLEFYQQQWPEQSSEDGNERVKNRIFTRHYFKLLEGYLSSC